MFDGNNGEKIKLFREKYPSFVYKKYIIDEDNENINIVYKYEIVGLKEFNHKIIVKKKDYIKNRIDNNNFKNIVFNIGIVEAINYWKATMSPKFIIDDGFLEEEQEEFFRKLYFNGLSELMYRNDINILKDDLIKFISNGIKVELENTQVDYGYMIPVGGGKDSCVTLENLDILLDRDYAFIVNAKGIQEECAKIRGFDDNHIFSISRIIDRGLIELNNLGYINGHVPISSVFSFLSYMASYLVGVKYIALSNENSANSPNIPFTNVNHQYSKSLEYENDFRCYSNKYLGGKIEYFSFLRGLNELEIAMLFSRYDKYHNVFKSCNLGSKNNPWTWCLECSKCLFVYVILSPFVRREKLIEIFGEDLLDKESLMGDFIDLIGHGNKKPFECVGTYEEVEYAISKTIKIMMDNGIKLPKLLEYYKNNYELKINEELLKEFDFNNNVSDKLNNKLRDELNDR